MSQPDKPFRFKHFELHQSRSAMRVGTDAVLLGCWVNPEGVNHILDVGTGTGVIALICAQRISNAFIEAIEIHEGSAEDAQYNFEHSPWRDRLRMHTGDFLKTFSVSKFDLIISNPPYFTQSLRATDPSRSAARHDDYLPAESFMKHARTLLNENGVVALILPAAQLERWVNAASANKLRPRRICHVFTLAHKDATRVMVEFSFAEIAEPAMESLLIGRNTGEFSEAYRQMTSEFYTKW